MSTKYTIKPLEWKRWGNTDETAWWDAGTPFGSYKVENNYGNWTWGYNFQEYYDEESGQHCESLEDGQQKAWENWLSRVLLALEPTE